MTEITEQQLEDWQAGKVELKDLIALDGDYMEQLKGRAQFFLDGKHHERALIMLEMLEELDRRDPLPTWLGIEILLEMGQSDSAGEKVDLLRERHGDAPEVWVAEAELLMGLGQLVPAAAAIEKVLAKDPDGKTPAGARALSLAARGHALFESA